MNIVLIGLRCSGKTSVGRLVAAMLGRPFLDLDDLTRERLGAASITEAFSRLGEQRFRGEEAVALEQVLSRRDHVIALGGGTPAAPGAESIIKRCRTEGTVRTIYLRARAETLKRRLVACGAADRPALLGRDPVSEVESVLATRGPLYERVSDLVVDVDALSILEAADRVVGIVRSPANGG